MAFNFTTTDVRKSQKCPVGMHIATLTEVEEPYFNAKGTTVQKVNFETDKGYSVPYWFNDKFMANLIEFVEAADNIKFDPEAENTDVSIDLKNYIGKKLAIAVSHRKDDNNKIQAQIDNFFSADKVPF